MIQNITDIPVVLMMIVIEVNNQNMVRLYQQKNVGCVRVVNINKNIDEKFSNSI